MNLMLLYVGRTMIYSSNSSSLQVRLVLASFFSSKRLGWALGLDCGGFILWRRAISARISSSDMSAIFAIGLAPKVLPRPGRLGGTHAWGHAHVPRPGQRTALEADRLEVRGALALLLFCLLRQFVALLALQIHNVGIDEPTEDLLLTEHRDGVLEGARQLGVELRLDLVVALPGGHIDLHLLHVGLVLVRNL